MAKSEEDVLFIVDGFKVINGHSYIVKHKADPSAPSGLKEEGVTKVPTAGAADSFQCPYTYDSKDPSSGVWDSGMTEYSPTYKNKSSKVAKSESTSLYMKVGLPYEKSIGKKGVMLDIANEDEFWKNLDFSVEANQLLKTETKKDVLTLYYGLRQKKLTPPDPNGHRNPKYNGSAFNIVDVTNNVKVKDERAAAEFNAIGDFTDMLRNNKAMLIPILKWIGIRPAKTAEDVAIMSLFKDHLAPPNTNVKRIAEFNQLVEDSGEDSGRNKILVYNGLDDATYKNQISKNSNGALVLDGLEIGLDLKSAAANIATKPEFTELRTKLILGEDS